MWAFPVAVQRFLPVFPVPQVGPNGRLTSGIYVNKLKLGGNARRLASPTRIQRGIESEFVWRAIGGVVLTIIALPVIRDIEKTR